MNSWWKTRDRLGRDLTLFDLLWRFGVTKDVWNRPLSEGLVLQLERVPVVGSRDSCLLMVELSTRPANGNQLIQPRLTGFFSRQVSLSRRDWPVSDGICGPGGSISELMYLEPWSLETGLGKQQVPVVENAKFTLIFAIQSKSIFSLG